MSRVLSDRWVPFCFGSFAVVGSFLTLVGWLGNFPGLTDWDGNGINMFVNTAIAAMCSAIAITTLSFARSSAVWILGTVVALIGGLTLAQHLTGGDFGIDQLVLSHQWGGKGAVVTGRMGPPASTSFLLMGIGLILSCGRPGGSARATATGLGLATTCIALLAITGYYFGADTLYTVPKFTGIAPQTAFMLFALGLGLVAAIPERQPMRAIREDSGAGVLARRAIPFIVLLPIVLGFLRVWGQKADLYDTGMGTAMLVVALIVLLCGVLWWGVLSVSAREQALQSREKQLRLVTDHAPVMIVHCDPQERYLFVNKVYAERFGLQPKDIIGKRIPEIVGIEAYASFEKHIRTALAGNPVEFEAEIPYAGIGNQFMRVAYMPERDVGGKVVGLVAAIINITDRKRAEEAVRDSEERFRNLAETVPSIVWTANPAGTITYANRRWLDYCGLTPRENAKRWPELVLHPDDYERCVAQWSKALSEGSEYEIEVRNRRYDGTYRWFVTRAIPQQDNEGKLVSWFGVTTDIHDQKMLEEQLRDADRRKDEFLATLAHELRNPLAPVRNALEIMKRADSNPPILETARATMDRQISQMVRLIDDLLDVSRITRNRLELRRERVELASIIHHAVESCRPMIDRAGQGLNVCLPSQPIYLHADPVRLAQVFGNLLTNASKYSEGDAPISLTVERQGSDAVVTVQDAGMGIPPEMLPEVFEMFTQVDRSLERSQGGLGIGLTLVKRLVEMHEGSVSANSEGLGRGSQFVVRLPILIDCQPISAEPRPDASTIPNMARRILVVDDNRDAASSLAMVLQLTGSETEIAHDGDEALEKALRCRPEVILLDIGLPKKNGYDVCRAIREQPWGRGILIVALTGWGQDDDRRKSKEAGFDGHLVKPVELATLTNLLAELRPSTDLAEASESH